MRICHFSDWHGTYRMLPKADLYICTGDMLPNFPLIKYEVDKWRRDGIVTWDPNAHLLGQERQQPEPGGAYCGRRVDPIREAGMQGGWISLENKKGGLRRWLANPSAPVIACRGNHCFIDLAEGFQGGPVWEVSSDPSRTTEILGLKFGGCRGINYIIGEWMDELMDLGQTGPQRTPTYNRIQPPAGNWEDVISKVPTDIDVLITHAPPKGILDVDGLSYGSKAIRRYIDQQLYNDERRLRAHFFGHIHRHCGSKNDGGILFSNAATTHLVYEI